MHSKDQFNKSFFLFFQALILFCVIGLSLGQEEVVNANGGVRRLRLRRPRPVPAISDPDGIAEGRPIPLRRIPQGKTSSSSQKTKFEK